MVADDEEVIREALREIFSEDPELSLVATACNAEEAAVLASLWRPDVALVDVKMEGGGPLATRSIRARSPRTAVLAYSAHDDRATVLEMLEAGAVGYVVKGATGREILAGVKQAAGGLTYLSSEVAGQVVGELADHLRRERAGEQRANVARRRVSQAMRDGMRVVLQPIVRLADGEPAGYEALSRFDPSLPGNGQEPRWRPDEWFAEAHQVGLGIDLELAAVRRAVLRLDDLPPDAYLGVNLSPDLPLLVDVAQQLPSRVLRRLVVEITEHARVEDYERLQAALSGLRSRGARVAVDDAGAGFASLRHILRLAPEIIKLDVSLTHGIDSDRQLQALAAAFITFGAHSAATIVAEGIETPAELEALRGLGVTHGQGFLIGRPG
jgi:EAL domain-containing protein (putative c-di-GMP-specific phosphodiesterase class I)